MIHEVFTIKQKGSLPNAQLITYIQDDEPNCYIKKRPCIIIIPGGGYGYLATDKEGEALVFRFCAMGYHVALLRYSVKPATYPTQILEVAEAVSMFRKHAEEWHIDTDKIVLFGGSAGGHVAASYGCFWHEDFVAKGIGTEDKEMLRPNGLILSYPVITSGEKAHRGSFENLCGDKYEELIEKVSLENQVNEYTPKTFMWHTFEDGTVPVENSLLFANALRKQKIPFELHIYPVGGHGLGLADKTTQQTNGWGIQEQCQSWITLAKTWLEHL